MKVAIIGQGYVGLNATLGALKAGHTVVGIDTNEKVVLSLNNGISHVEGIASSSLSSAVASGNFYSSSSFDEVKGAEVVILAVPTPLTGSGEPDLSFLEDATSAIAPFLDTNSLIINESTSFVGTLTNLIASRIKRINPLVTDFAVSPERVDPGNSIYGLINTPRLVGGTSRRASDRAVAFYSTFCKSVVLVSSPEVAEAAKLLENTFRFVNIGFINEFTKILNSMGVSASEVISSASTKPYGFMPFLPNVGVGGHCIPVDPFYFQRNAQEIGLCSDYIKLAQKVNEDMPRYSIERLESIYGNLHGARVLVIGVSYKPDIADTRESPAKNVFEQLRDRGADVSWHDPLVSSYLNIPASSPSETYDLGLVLVKHKCLNLSKWKGAPIYCVFPDEQHPNWIPILDYPVSE